jgi:hypothetical protein
MTDLQREKHRAYLIEVIRRFLPQHLKELFDELLALG